MQAAFDGRFPAVDGVVEIHPVDAAGQQAVVEFTGHSVVLTDRVSTDPIFVGLTAFGDVTDARVITALAGPDGNVGVLDAVLVRRVGASRVAPLAPTDAYLDHPRVRRAHHHRAGVTVLGDERGVVCFGHGLVGRLEIAIEVEPQHRGHGRGLLDAALATLAVGTPIVAQVAPGNAASLRLFLAAGFTPIGSEVLL